MPSSPNDTTISIKKTTREALKRRMHLGQSFDGFLLEMLNEVPCVTQSLLKKLERYRTRPEDSLDDLVNKVLDENREFERQISKKQEG